MLRLAFVLSIVLLAALAPAASSAIKFGKIHYNSPGSDSGSNASLNGEWITIKNTGNSVRSLTGWTVRDKAGHVYRFGTFRLGAHKTVKLHTGKGSNRPLHRYWGSSGYIWNNDKDTARLRNANGGLVDTCSYNASAKSEKLC